MGFSPWRILQLLLLFFALVYDTLIYSIIYGIRGPKGLLWRQVIPLALARAALHRNIVSFTWPAPPTTGEVYRAFMNGKRLPIAVEEARQGARILWIAEPTVLTSKTLVFFHGGGYCNAAVSSHLELLYDKTRKFHPKLAVAVVEYTLAPTRQYPYQLQQGVSILHFLQQVRGIAPSNMIISGDSAGGNLTAALLFHSVHPHPGVERLNLCGGPLAGAFLVSPWVTFKTTSQSMKRNVYGDYVDYDSIRRAASLFADGKEDTYCAPLTATATSWKGIKVKRLAILAGEFEIMVDDIIQFAENVKKYNPDAQFHIAAKEAHVQMVVSRLLRLPVAESERVFEQWLYTILN